MKSVTIHCGFPTKGAALRHGFNRATSVDFQGMGCSLSFPEWGWMRTRLTCLRATMRVWSRTASMEGEKGEVWARIWLPRGWRRMKIRA
jgi:hypothetical protein